MFVDKVTVSVKAGNGGNGAVSFRHEKYVDKGGPDGGDGGNGGDVIFVAEHNQSSLAAFRFQPKLNAESGVNGSKRKKRGASGDDLLVKVPVGTVVVRDDRIVADLTEEGQRATVAEGGRGGFGNAHFISSTRQAPRVAELGEKGDDYTLILELKMLADVGLIGLPNAGKSTFLSVVSNATPEIADYPFTTLKPNLGVADFDSHSLLIADIPGLIEGASKGKGLGVEFLRHVERTQVLLHLIDVTSNDVVADYETIRKELREYAVDMTKKPQIVALTKTDTLDEELVAMQMKELRAVLPVRTKLIAITAKNKQSLLEVLRETYKIVVRQRKKKTVAIDPDAVPIYELQNDDAWRVTVTGTTYIVSGRKIERFAERTDTESEYGVRRLRDIMRKMGIMHELERKKAERGTVIHIGNKSIKY